MDAAVALVQTYLHINGYFTVAEYPVLEALQGDSVRTDTDLDILAYRFPVAGHDVVDQGGHRPFTSDGVDPVLGCTPDRADMIVGEVKQGAPRLNPGVRDPAVLEVALTRFGCCPANRAEALSRALIRHGRAITPAGHAIRMVAFGDTHVEGRHGAWHTVPMAHVVRYLQQYVHQYWPVLRHAQLPDSPFAVLALMEKWSIGQESSDTAHEGIR